MMYSYLFLVIFIVFIYFWFITTISKKNSINEQLLKLFFFITFFLGIFRLLNFFPLEIRAISEFIIIFLFIFNFSKTNKLNLYIIRNFFLLFSFVYFFSAFLNTTSMDHLLIEYRFYLLPFLLFIAVANTHLKENQYRSINKNIFFLCILQIIASVVKYEKIGVMESIVGTISDASGTTTTVFATGAIGFVFSFIIMKKKYIPYIFLIIGFLFFGWAGSKRGIYFYIPIMLSVIYFFYLYRVRKINFHRMFQYVFVAIIFFLAFIYLGGRLSPTLNPEGEVGGKFNLSYMYNFASYYNFHEKTSGPTQRFSGIISTINELKKSDTLKILFGFGPAYITIYRTENLGPHRGFWGREVGITNSLITVGFIGTMFLMFFYFSIIRLAYQKFKVIVQSRYNYYWKSIAIATFSFSIFILIDFLSYSRTSQWNHLIAPLFYYFLASICIVSRQINKSNKGHI